MSKISGAAKLAGVMGWPISHSKSPRLHGHWLQRYDIDGAYVPLAVAPENLVTAVAGLQASGFRGFNVTLPHKQAIIAHLDHLSDTALRIGAVNTVVFQEDGHSFGDNTDAFGFIEALRAGAPDWQAPAGPAVLLGAGGAARAIAVALVDAGVPDVCLINRTQSKAAALANDLGGPISVGEWSEMTDKLATANLLVNSTSLGMMGSQPLDIDLDPLGAGATVMDAVYAPLETDLLIQARSKGLAAVDGLGMLLHQARPGFNYWFGVQPDVDEDLRQACLGD